MMRRLFAYIYSFASREWRAVLPLLLSICALSLTLYGAHASRVHERLSMMPRVTIYQWFTADSIGVSFTNNGLGPAEIKYFEVLVDSTPVKTWSQAAILLWHSDSVRFVWTQLAPRQLLSSGKTGVLFQINSRNAMEAYYPALDEHLNVRVCYCSLYGECWLESLEKTVAECKEGEHVFNGI